MGQGSQFGDNHCVDDPRVDIVDPQIDPRVDHVDPQTDTRVDNVHQQVDPRFDNVDPKIEPRVDNIDPTIPLRSRGDTHNPPGPTLRATLDVRMPAMLWNRPVWAPRFDIVDPPDPPMFHISTPTTLQ